MHKDWIAVEERRLEAQNSRFEKQLETQERVAQIQAEGQASKTIQSFYANDVYVSSLYNSTH